MQVASSSSGIPGAARSSAALKWLPVTPWQLSASAMAVRILLCLSSPRFSTHIASTAFGAHSKHRTAHTEAQAFPERPVAGARLARSSMGVAFKGEEFLVIGLSLHCCHDMEGIQLRASMARYSLLKCMS